MEEVRGTGYQADQSAIQQFGEGFVEGYGTAIEDDEADAGPWDLDDLVDRIAGLAWLDRPARGGDAADRVQPAIPVRGQHLDARRADVDREDAHPGSLMTDSRSFSVAWISSCT